MTEETKKENGQVNTPPEQTDSDYKRIIAEKEAEITVLRKSEGELKEKLSAANKSLTEAVASYKDRVIQANPGIAEELISGNTIAAVEKSVEMAIDLVSRVKKSMEKERLHTKVPAGAPGRRAADVSAMSPREKIQYAIGGKK